MATKAKETKAAAAPSKKKLVTKEYVLLREVSGEATILKSGKKGNLTYFDEEEGTRKAIRHCPNQKSIFLGEQDSFALVTPIIFMAGRLEVKGDQPITQQFLDSHPDNKANGGYWFESIDEEKEARESIQLDELKADIMYQIRQKSKEENGLQELSAVVSVLEGSVEAASRMGIESLKRILYNEVDVNPMYFTNDSGEVNIFDDEVGNRTYIVLQALQNGILAKSDNKRSIVWAKDKKVIATAPRSIDLIEYFVDFLTEDEGILILEEIAKRS